MVGELDTVALTHDIDEHGLKRGDVGSVVHCYHNETGFEVEFVTGEGRTVAVLTLTGSDFRSNSNGEILHVRDFTAA